MTELSPQVRSAIARQTWKIRGYDITGDELEYATWRDYESYLGLLMGLDATRQHILNDDTLPMNLLDIGCGEGCALNKFLQNWPEFTIVAATLSPSLIRPKITRDVPSLHLVPRSIERLPTIIPPNHFGLMISVYGLHYCQNAVYAVDAIDYLLAPGGILKCCGTIDYRIENPEIGFDGLVRYAELLQKKRYSVICEKNILFAMKPNGHDNSTLADALFNEDYKKLISS